MARKKDSPAPQAAEKSRKKKKDGRLKQIWQVFQMTRRTEPLLPVWIIGAMVVIMGGAFGIGLLVDSEVYALIISVPLALLAATFILARRAEAVAYKNLEGQPGAVGAALGSIRRGWTIEEEPVAIDPRTQDLVFQAVGRAGIVLVGEGPAPRIERLLNTESRRVNRILPSVPLHTFQVGRGEGQIPLPKIARKVQRLRPQLTKQETYEVVRRLKALGGARLPIPKGVDPMRARPDRKGLRGR